MRPGPREGLLRWLRFSAVGMVGVAVQLSVLWLCSRLLRIPVAISIAVAVSVAVLHNFAWHEAWTWKEMPAAGRWGRLMRFYASNGFLAIASNTILTMLFKQYLSMPLLVSNALAIGLTAVLNFALADRWVFRRAGALLAVGVIAGSASAAVLTTKLQDNTIAAWNTYMERAERAIVAPDHPLLDIPAKGPALIDLNPTGESAGEDVPNGYIHHWTGAVRIPRSTVESVRAVLEDYGNYPRIYAPRVKRASAVKIEDTPAARVYDVTLVSEQVEGFGVHFAFNIRSHVTFRNAGNEGRVESRSYLIRESDSGKAPFLDLLPEGNDHGIAWRLNSYWRLRQTGDAVYAECQVISLSRKPLFGMHDQVKSRARNSLRDTLLETRDRALR
jgi:putative flippase GtrA